MADKGTRYNTKDEDDSRYTYRKTNYRRGMICNIERFSSTQETEEWSIKQRDVVHRKRTIQDIHID